MNPSNDLIKAKCEMNGSLLHCTGLVKNFVVRHSAIRVLNGIDLAIGKGEVVAVTGRSGSGKSTLISLLGGLDRATAGSITFDGVRFEETSNTDLARLRRNRIGVMFQNFNLLPSWTAVENVEAALVAAGVANAERRKERREKAAAALAALGLGGRLLNLPSELSAGEQQRVALARALANNPALILADEPTADVDPEAAVEITRRLIGPVRSSGAALLVATHGAFPLDLADRVFLMRDGRLEPRSQH